MRLMCCLYIVRGIWKRINAKQAEGWFDAFAMGIEKQKWAVHYNNAKRRLWPLNSSDCH